MNDCNVTLREAVTLEDCERMRKVRNACREFMTNDNSEISHERQKDWFKNLDRNFVIPFLVETKEEAPSIVGFGIIRFKNDRYWLTGGLLPEHRGKGFGEQLFRLLIDETSLPVWLEVLEDNLPAMKLYHKLGFRATGLTASSKYSKRIVTMVLHPELSPTN